MAIRFVNIRRRLSTGKFEEAVADTEPKIAALWSTSDHSPNITQGQDMGWRMAPEVVIEMKHIKQDITALERIAARYRKALEDLNEVDILHWISDKTSLEAAPLADVNDYQDEYDASVRALEQAGKKAVTVKEPTSTTDKA
jgi:hypothetical protein